MTGRTGHRILRDRQFDECSEGKHKESNKLARWKMSEQG